jgi:hypothetical protein
MLGFAPLGALPLGALPDAGNPTITSATTDGADTSAGALSVLVAATSATTDGADTSAGALSVLVAATSATTDGADASAAVVEPQVDVAPGPQFPGFLPHQLIGTASLIEEVVVVDEFPLGLENVARHPNVRVNWLRKTKPVVEQPKPVVEQPKPAVEPLPILERVPQAAHVGNRVVSPAVRAAQVSVSPAPLVMAHRALPTGAQAARCTVFISASCPVSTIPPTVEPFDDPRMRSLSVARENKRRAAELAALLLRA